MAGRGGGVNTFSAYLVGSRRASFGETRCYLCYGAKIPPMSLPTISTDPSPDAEEEDADAITVMLPYGKNEAVHDESDDDDEFDVNDDTGPITPAVPDPSTKLSSDLAALERDLAQLRLEVEIKRSELERTRKDRVDLEQRIDQLLQSCMGLNRSQMDWVLPARFEPMMILADREQEMLRAVLDQVDYLERIVTRSRRSKRNRRLVADLLSMQQACQQILQRYGVEYFDIAIDTVLGPAHRAEVQIVTPKQWGAKESTPLPFQPGLVKKVVRKGAWAGYGEHLRVLRRVEVVIRREKS